MSIPSKPITSGGRTQSIGAWAREIGVSRQTLAHRLRHGWPIEKALTKPTRRPSITREALELRQLVRELLPLAELGALGSKESTRLFGELKRRVEVLGGWP